jgi:hypothetical protein
MFVEFLYAIIWFLISGIITLSLAGSVGKYFFVDLFFWKKREDCDIPNDFYRFWCKIFKKGCIYKVLS